MTRSDLRSLLQCYAFAAEIRIPDAADLEEVAEVADDAGA